MTEPAHPQTRRAPRSTAESLCWIVLAYVAAPVLTLMFSALGVTGWVHAQHGPVRLTTDAVSLGGMVLISLGVASLGVIIVFTVATGRAVPASSTVLGALAAGCWMAFASLGVASPARVLHGGSAAGALVVLAWWGGVFYLEAAARRVLRAEVSNRPAASTGHLPAGYDTWTGRS